MDVHDFLGDISMTSQGGTTRLHRRGSPTSPTPVLSTHQLGQLSGSHPGPEEANQGQKPSQLPSLRSKPRHY